MEQYDDDGDEIKHVLGVVMLGKPITPIEIQFVLEDFIKGKKIMIGDSYVFEILEVTNGTILLKPIGINLLEKVTLNTKNNTITYRFIKDDKIVEGVEC